MGLPDLIIGFDRCSVIYFTRSIAGVTEHDFRSAARVEAVFDALRLNTPSPE